VRILTDNGLRAGPEGREELDTVIAGRPGGIDSTRHALRMKGSDLGYVRIAAEHKFGVMDLNKLRSGK